MLEQIHEAFKKLPKGECEPHFEAERDQWLCTHARGALGAGQTPIEALRHYCQLSQLDEARTFVGGGEKWRPVVDHLNALLHEETVL